LILVVEGEVEGHINEWMTIIRWKIIDENLKDFVAMFTYIEIGLNVSLFLFKVFIYWYFVGLLEFNEVWL